MSIAVIVVAVMVGLLSIGAGAAKVGLAPQEVEFLGQLGLGNATIIALGVGQLIGGVMVIIPHTRRAGALITAVGFAISAGLIGMSGNLVFAGLSMFPVLLAGGVAYAATHGANEAP